MVVEWVGGTNYFLGCRAIVCLCLCRLVESSSYVFTVIKYDGRVRGVSSFCRYFRLVESVGRSWRLLTIFRMIVGVRFSRLRCRD